VSLIDDDVFDFMQKWGKTLPIFQEEKGLFASPLRFNRFDDDKIVYDVIKLMEADFEQLELIEEGEAVIDLPKTKNWEKEKGEKFSGCSGQSILWGKFYLRTMMPIKWREIKGESD
jgi:hypothetical protein